MSWNELFQLLKHWNKVFWLFWTGRLVHIPVLDLLCYIESKSESVWFTGTNMEIILHDLVNRLKSQSRWCHVFVCLEFIGCIDWFQCCDLKSQNILHVTVPWILVNTLDLWAQAARFSILRAPITAFYHIFSTGKAPYRSLYHVLSTIVASKKALLQGISQTWGHHRCFATFALMSMWRWTGY